MHDNYQKYNTTKLQEFYNTATPRKICRVGDKFNIFKIKWNRIILDEAHEKLTPVVKLFSTSIKNFLDHHHKLNFDEQFLFENLVALRGNYKWAITGTPSQNGIDNIMGILQFLVKRNILNTHYKTVEHIRYFSNLVGITSRNME